VEESQSGGFFLDKQGQQASHASHLGGNWEKCKVRDFFLDKQANRQAMPLHLGGNWEKYKAGDFFSDKQANRQAMPLHLGYTLAEIGRNRRMGIFFWINRPCNQAGFNRFEDF